MTLQELGQAIQEKRKAANLSIDDVAVRTKISRHTLRSIEEGSLGDLPHAVYAKGFIHAFGKAIGFERQELTDSLEQIFPPEEGNTTWSVPGMTAPVMRAPSRFKRVFLLIGLCLVAVGLALGAWFVFTSYGDVFLELIKQPFSAVNSPAEKFVETAFARLPVNNSSTVPVSAQTLPKANTPVHAEIPAAVAPAPPQEKEPQEPAKTAPAQVAPEEKQQLQLTAKEACWVGSQVDGVKERGILLKPSESFTWVYKENMTLTLGNAGGVVMNHNGRDLGAPGRAGQRLVLHFPPKAE